MPVTLNEHAYHFLREKLLTGELGPPGTRVSDFEVARKIGISRTPVREAINQLASEGLLDRRPRVGFFVKQPDRRELEELYDLRILLESYAAGKVAEARDPEVGTLLSQACAEMTRVIDDVQASGAPTLAGEQAVRWFSAESTFHVHVLEGAGNRQVRKIASELRLMTQIMGRHRIDHTVADLTRIQGEHSRILQAILAGDAAKARALMEKHIERSKRDTLKCAALQSGPPAPIVRPEPAQDDWPVALRQSIYRIESEHLAKP